MNYYYMKYYENIFFEISIAFIFSIIFDYIDE